MAENKDNLDTVETETPECEETVETVEGVVEDTVEENTETPTEESEEADPEDISEEENESEEAESEEGKSEESIKSKLFGKKKKDKRDQQIEDLTDRLKRTMAEFDNFRKRTEKEKASMYIIGAKDIVEKILPIVDNFERGLAQASDEDPFAVGMKMTYKMLLDTLEGLGVKQIEALGKEFDPNLHNAVMHEENDEVGENIITEEFQKGYTYKDFVVRHSMVKVAN